MDKKKILVVDDEPEITRGFEVRLRYWGYDVRTARNAEECFQSVVKLPFLDHVRLLRCQRAVECGSWVAELARITPQNISTAREESRSMESF